MCWALQPAGAGRPPTLAIGHTARPYANTNAAGAVRDEQWEGRSRDAQQPSTTSASPLAASATVAL